MATERVLVDTSAWISGFLEAGDPALKEFLKHCISSGFAATCPVVILELLRGCKTETERNDLRTKAGLQRSNVPRDIRSIRIQRLTARRREAEGRRGDL